MWVRVESHPARPRGPGEGEGREAATRFPRDRLRE